MYRSEFSFYGFGAFLPKTWSCFHAFLLHHWTRIKVAEQSIQEHFEKENCAKIDELKEKLAKATGSAKLSVCLGCQLTNSCKAKNL